MIRETFPEIFVKIREDDVILQLVMSFSYNSHIMTLLTKMLTSSQKKHLAHLFWSNPIKEMLNKRQTAFVVTRIKNNQMGTGGGESPLPPTPQPIDAPKSPISVGLKDPTVS